MKFEVSDVKKLISSAANMVDAGIELHFTDKGCWAQKGKHFIPIERKGKLFVLKVKRKQGRVQAIDGVPDTGFDAMMDPFDQDVEEQNKANEEFTEMDPEKLAGDPGDPPNAAPLPVERREPPPRPDDEEVRVHNLMHLPFAAWCPPCIMAKGKESQSQKLPRNQGQGMAKSGS